MNGLGYLLSDRMGAERGQRRNEEEEMEGDLGTWNAQARLREVNA